MVLAFGDFLVSDKMAADLAGMARWRPEAVSDEREKGLVMMVELTPAGVCEVKMLYIM